MKTVVTFLVLVVLSGFSLLRAQQVALSYDFDDPGAIQLISYPGDSSKFICVQEFGNFPDYEYHLQSMQNGLRQDIDFPSLSLITSIPVEFNGSIVFSATTLNRGNELVIFDGQDTTIIDIEAGATSSSPVCFIKNGTCYVIARSGNFRQLFELESNFSLTQLTQENSLDVYQFISRLQDKIFYATNELPDSIIHIKAVSLGTQNTNEIYASRGFYIYDANVFQDQVYFDLLMTGYFSNYSVNKLMKVDYNENATVLMTDSIPISFQNFKSFVFQNKYYLVKPEDFNLYVSTDGIDFSPEITLDSAVIDEIILLGSTCHLIIESSEDQESLAVLDNGQLTVLQEFNYHCHYLSEKGNFRYYVSIEYDPVLHTQLVEVNLTSNELLMFPITDHSSHPPYSSIYDHGGTWIGNTLYFIYGNYFNFLSYDIYSFDPESGLNQLEPENSNFSIYPNPVSVDGSLNVHSTYGGTLSISTVDGKHIEELEIKPGHDVIDASRFASGSYLIRQGDSVKKFIIMR